MLRALAADFTALAVFDRHAGAIVRLPHVEFCERHGARSCQRAARTRNVARVWRAADWSIIIAPEFDGHLASRCLRGSKRQAAGYWARVRRLRRLPPTSRPRPSDLAAHGMNVPRGVGLRPRQDLPRAGFRYPAVLKPRVGAGSLGIQQIEHPADFGDIAKALDEHTHHRLEEFCPGTAASVACLCGPHEIVPLVPCRQLLSNDGGLPIWWLAADRAGPGRTRDPPGRSSRPRLGPAEHRLSGGRPGLGRGVLGQRRLCHRDQSADDDVLCRTARLSRQTWPRACWQ